MRAVSLSPASGSQWLPSGRFPSRVRALTTRFSAVFLLAHLKSAAILFEQSLVRSDIARAETAARECEVLLAVGTTLAVYPAAGMVPIASRSGARIVILNAEPTELDHLADLVIRAPISEALPEICGLEEYPTP